MNWVRNQVSLLQQHILVLKAQRVAAREEIRWLALHGEDYDNDVLL